MHWLGKAQRIVLFMFTFSYYGSLRHYTLDRLLEIEQHQHDIEFVKVLLKNFKRRKVEELQLVRKGVWLVSSATRDVSDLKPFLGGIISCNRDRDLLLAEFKRGVLAQPALLVQQSLVLSFCFGRIQSSAIDRCITWQRLSKLSGCHRRKSCEVNAAATSQTMLE